jgi:hypothetical protein
MKSKALIVCSTILMALALMAQSTTPTSPALSTNQAKSCACCNGGNADAKTACCGKDASCCAKGGGCCQGKDRKQCPMMSKDSNGKMSCCSGGKCSMMSEKAGKKCCGGKMCERPQSGV